MLKELFRTNFGLNLILSGLGILFVVFALLVLKLKPCPLCLIQQFCLVGLLVVSLIALFVAKKQIIAKLFLIVSLVICVAAASVAGKQVHLQYFPEKPVTTKAENAAACDAVSNQFVLNVSKSLTGSIESCSSKDEEVAGITLAGYSLAYFILIIVLNIVFLINRFRKN